MSCPKTADAESLRLAEAQIVALEEQLSVKDEDLRKNAEEISFLRNQLFLSGRSTIRGDQTGLKSGKSNEKNLWSMAASSALSSVFGNKDLVILISSMLPQSSLAPLKMTCKLFKEFTEDSGFRSNVKYYCSSVTMATWALYMQCNAEELMKEASRQGSIAVLRYCRSLNPPCVWKAGYCVLAASQGNLETLKWLRSQDPPCPWNSKCCSEAVENGHLHVLQWLRSQSPPCSWSTEVYECASKVGSLDILEWIFANRFKPKVTSSWKSCRLAATHSHVDVLQWLLCHGFSSDYIWIGAVESGNVEVMRWVSDNVRSVHDDNEFEDLCAFATLAGKVESLRCLRALHPPCPYGKGTCAYAAGNGQLDILKWLRSQNPPCPWDEQSCENAASGGHVETLQWLRSQSPPCPWDIQMVYVNALACGDLDILKFLYRLSPDAIFWGNIARLIEALADSFKHSKYAADRTKILTIKEWWENLTH